MEEQIPRGICQCGCGRATPLAVRNTKDYQKGEPTLFISGHVGKLNSYRRYENSFSLSSDGETLKVCTVCKIPRPISEFSRRTRTGEKLRCLCRTCTNEQAVARYKQNPEPFRRKCSREGKVGRGRRRKILSELRANNGCVVCGEKDICVLDFHHLHGSSKSKHGGMTVTCAAAKSWKSMWAEIAKCIIVCANCHRKIHAGLVVPPSLKKE